MPPVVIDNPILNSPFTEPARHFRFSEDGITDEAVQGRRASGYFLPIASPRKKGGQLKFETEWTQDRFQSSPRINRIRERVSAWRTGGYVGCTRLTERLLRYWADPERERKLFFCQIEALETAIYLTEVAGHYGDAWIENELREENATFNGGLPRLAMKMATGSGKTVVMAMLIAWQALNKLENRQDRRFSDAFLIVTPGITIRDRLRVLFPTDPENYYRQRDVLPPDLLERLGQAAIVITNYHAFLLHERGDAARLTKSILTKGETNPFVETPDQMVRRVCRELAGKKQIVVLNDEAHHCYRPKPSEETGAEKLAGGTWADAARLRGRLPRSTSGRMGSCGRIRRNHTASTPRSRGGSSPRCWPSPSAGSPSASRSRTSPTRSHSSSCSWSSRTTPPTGSTTPSCPLTKVSRR